MTRLTLILAVSALCVGLSLQQTRMPGGGMGGMDGSHRMGGSYGMDGSRGMDGSHGMDGSRGMDGRKRKGGCAGGMTKKDPMKEMMMMMMMGGGTGGGGMGGGMNPMMMYMMMNQMKDMMGGDHCERDCDRDHDGDRDRDHKPMPRPQSRPRIHLPCRVDNGDGNAVQRMCGMKMGQQMSCDIGPIMHESSGWSFTFCTIPCPRQQDLVQFKDTMKSLGMTEREMMGMDDGDMADREIPDGGPVTDDDRLFISLMIRYMRYVREECGMMTPTGMPMPGDGDGWHGK